MLRFGEIKLTSSEQNELYKKVKNTMNYKMNEKDLIREAEDKTVQSVSELIKTFLSTTEFNNMNVLVQFK